MKIQWFRSATVGLFSESGTSLLCDPWITDGAFIGSWHHWPPLEGFEFDELLDRPWNGIYISHFHADHFDRRWLAAYLRSWDDVRVIIPNYANKWLKRAVLNCGLPVSRLIEAPSNRSFKFGDFNVKIFVADYCNPSICGSSISCGSTPRRQSSNDSVALIEADGQKVLNANDALAVETVHKLWPVIGSVDLLLGHFGGAGPFPQCFTDLSDQVKTHKAKETGWSFVNRLSQAAEKLQASFTFPYAGQYVLGGELCDLNPFRSVIPMQDVEKFLQESSVTTPISLAPFREFNLSTESVEEEWCEPGQIALDDYLAEIRSHTFPYQRGKEDWPDGADVLHRALERVKDEFRSFLSEGGVGSDSSITIRSGDLLEAINFGRTNCWLSTRADFEHETVISLDKRLLRRLVVRRPGYRGFTSFHFNQAEIGSHMSWTRRGPYPPETSFLNYMHAESI